MNRYRPTFTALLCLLGCFALVFHLGCQNPTDPGDSVGFAWVNSDLRVEFTDTTVPPGKSWSWSFGDALGKSNEQNPTYTYGFDGIYDVRFTSCSRQGMEGNCETITRGVTVP